MRFMSAKANASQAVFLCLLLVTSWALMHHYALAGDGELYAVQAMARINPQLNSDIYLSATSQDKYTLFSPLYAWTIRLLGLQQAGAALFAVCTFSLIAAGWVIARSLWNERTAWLAAGMLVIAASNYGAYGVFQYAESYLTARTMSEALVVASLAAYFRGFAKLAWGIAASSMFIHPLMTLPGVLFLGCLSVPLRHSLMCVAAGLAMTVLIVIAASISHFHSNYLTVVSGPWLEMVRERSQFLFLRYWKIADWEAHARVLLCLMLSTQCAVDSRVRRLGAAAFLVGAVGLIVAWIAGTFGPVAILLQGQAWRWFWVTAFTTVLMLIPTAIRLWKEGGCGAVCAVLLIASWTFPPVNGAYLAATAMVLWTVRSRVRPPTQYFLKMAAYAIVAAMLIWAAADIWSVCTNRPVIKTDEPLLIERLRSIWALQMPVLLLVALANRWIRFVRTPYVPVACTALLLAVCAFAIPGTFKQIGSLGTSGEIDAFLDWRAIIPPTENVLIVPKRNSAAFLWFSLQRPSYLTVNQSAGVVFSPITSLEIRRRAEVLLPIEDPDWRVLTQNMQKERGEKIANQSRPLTTERLMAVCADPQLGFVIAKESLGFNALVHTGPGEFKGWNLYDCRQLRKSGSTA
jgi:hypothetical protein